MKEQEKIARLKHWKVRRMYGEFTYHRLICYVCVCGCGYAKCASWIYNKFGACMKYPWYSSVRTPFMHKFVKFFFSPLPTFILYHHLSYINLYSFFSLLPSFPFLFVVFPFCTSIHLLLVMLFALLRCACVASFTHLPMWKNKQHFDMVIFI